MAIRWRVQVSEERRALWEGDVEGPCADRIDQHFPLQTSLGPHSPGGLELFRDPAGTLWAVYDTWNRPARNGRFYCCRSLDVAPVLSL